ncbi:MAG TPA: NAD(P)-binding domain-containing protein [Gaiellaceae bacterium]
MSTYTETVIVGGGQFGLMAGYYLAKRGRPFVILDANERTGDSWRDRWDSLRLFTPALFSRLPGKRLDMPNWAHPTKDEVADYLEEFAAEFELPVRHGLEVDGLSKEDGRFVVTAGDESFEADNVIVATGAHNIPKTPAFAAEIDPRTVQLHSSEYRNPSQLQDGDVLLVGAGNSGAELAVELRASRRVVLAGPKIGQIPVKHGTFPARIGFRVFRFVGHRVLTKSNPIGRKAAMNIGPDPLIRTRAQELEAAGVERVGRVTGVAEGRPLLEDGRALDVANVIWCTGFRTDFGWIDLPVFDENGDPEHVRGVVEAEPGLYFLGLIFLHSFSSDVFPNRGRDASYVAKHIASHRSRKASSPRRELTAA